MMTQMFNRRQINRLIATTLTLLAAWFAPNPINAQTDRAPRPNTLPVKIGAGGYITGIAIHPNEPDIMYARTDVGGAYRWLETENQWIQMVTGKSFPDRVGTREEVGIEAIATAPSNSQIVVMAVFDTIYRSTDGGRRFTQIGGTFDLQPNNPNEWRVHGERLAINPTDSDNIIFSSRNDGTWYTRDGLNWHITNLPNGRSDVGGSTVVFSPNNAEAYVGIVDEGIYSSPDEGQTWNLISGISGGPANTNIEPTDIEIAADGTVYVTLGQFGEFGQTQTYGSVWKYREGASWGTGNSDWMEITPPNRWSGDYISVAVDPTLPERLIVSEPGFKIANYSTDGGLSWTELVDGWDIAPLRNSPEIPWLETSGANWFEHGEIQFDPHSPDRLFAANGAGVWYSDAVADQVANEGRLAWTTMARGIEELVARDIVSIPGNAPIMGAMDFTAFRITAPKTYSAERSWTGEGLFDTWDMAYQESDPNFIAMSAYKFGVNRSSISLDGGLTWQPMGSVEQQQHPANLNWGVLAVGNSDDATDRTIVWSPADNSLPYYSLDDGQSWNPVESWPTGSDGQPIPTGIWFQWFFAQTLTADANTNHTYYMYLKAEDGVVVKSSDGGRNWELLNEQLPMWCHNGVLRSVRGRPGHLWFATGRDAPTAGLWFSEDSGASFSLIPGFDEAISVAIGKSRRVGGLPVVYVMGIRNGVEGIYRSENEGQSWARIVRGRMMDLLDTPTVLEADKNVFGKVYVGFSGTGFSFFSPRNRLTFIR